jgi:hypothetical protein
MMDAAIGLNSKLGFGSGSSTYFPGNIVSTAELQVNS